MFRAAEKSAPQVIADTIFTNLFIWRSYYQASWAEAHGCLCLLAGPEGEEPFGLPPVGAGDQLAALDFTLEALKGRARKPVFKRVPEALVEKIEAAGRPYEWAPDRDNDDYVYRAEQLRTLSGRRMHQKKNHYNYFVAHNQFEVLPLTPDLTPELLAVQESWLATKEAQNIPSNQLSHEVESVHELVRRREELNQLGLAIRIGGRIAGFTMGEIMSPDTVLVHLEKADYEIRGLFVALSSHFCRTLSPEIVYVNREQDLGLPGLRHSKESLKPDHMRRKYIVTPQ
ncbi:MAG: phosphatidylglycerol lysyltransferase domain-containing protein [Candidatus Adiutrix sp.]|nr:phosphatidylglycerol lysyltransferase domain-containing protein [Candidatus Adiutrix sp.]